MKVTDFFSHDWKDCSVRWRHDSIISQAMSFKRCSRCWRNSASGQCRSRMNDWRASNFQKRSSDVAQPFLKFCFFVHRVVWSSNRCRKDRSVGVLREEDYVNVSSDSLWKRFVVFIRKSISKTIMHFKFESNFTKNEQHIFIIFFRGFKGWWSEEGGKDEDINSLIFCDVIFGSSNDNVTI